MPRAGTQAASDRGRDEGMLTERAAEDEAETQHSERAWMVRGSNVDGYNLVPDWLHDGFVSLSASQLGGLDPGRDYES